MLCVQVSGDGFTALHLAAAFGASLCLSQHTATHTHPPTRTHEHKKTCIHARAHTHTHWMYMWVAATVCWITRASSTGPQRARTSARLHARSHTRTHSRARDYTRDRTQAHAHKHAHAHTHTRTRTWDMGWRYRARNGGVSITGGRRRWAAKRQGWEHAHAAGLPRQISGHHAHSDRAPRTCGGPPVCVPVPKS